MSESEKDSLFLEYMLQKVKRWKRDLQDIEPANDSEQYAMNHGSPEIMNDLEKDLRRTANDLEQVKKSLEK